MRILQLTPRVSSPPMDGGAAVMHQCAEALRNLGAEVEVLSLNPRRQRVDAPGSVDIDTSAVLMPFVRAVRLGIPPFIARFYSPAFASLLERRLRDGAFDVVQIESPFLMPYARVVRRHSNALVVLRSLNVEFRIWERLAARATSALRRFTYRIIARTLHRYERDLLGHVDALIAITEADAEEFRAMGCTRPMFVLPGGVEPRVPHTAPAATSRTVGFLGSLDYLPNQDAALWIAGELAPRLSGVEIHVAGSRAPESLRARLQSSTILFDGEVRDAHAFIDSMQVMIVPVFSGGGMRIKILDAMAAGKPVVSTTVGAEGVDVTNGQNILIADDADVFAEAVRTLLDHRELARAIGEAGRALVATRYSTLELTAGLLAFYEKVAQRARVGTR